MRFLELSRIGQAFDAMVDSLSRAHERIQANEARLQAIFDVEPECVVLLTQEGLSMVEADSRDAVVGKPIFPLLAEAHRAAFRDFLSAVCRGEVRQIEFDIVGLKGTRRAMDSRAAPFPDPATAGVGTLAVMRDMAEQERAEQALRESEERFRQLAENIREVFWLTDPEKNAMLYVSPGYEKIWGRPCRSLYAEPRAWLDAVHPEDRERVLQAALTEQVAGTYDLEYRILRPDGVERWIRDRAFPIRDSGGTVYRIAGVAEDITERKKTEARLRESEADFRGFFDDSGRGKVLRHLRGLGWRPQRARRGQERLIRRLWYELYALGAVHYPEDQALNTFVKRMTGVSGFHRLPVKQGQIVIESLKAWRRRVNPAPDDRGLGTAQRSRRIEAQPAANPRRDKRPESQAAREDEEVRRDRRRHIG